MSFHRHPNGLPALRVPDADGLIPTAGKDAIPVIAEVATLVTIP